MPWTLSKDLAFVGGASAPSAGGNIGTPSVNWSTADAALQDPTGGIWSIASGILTPASGQDYKTDWALRPSSEDALYQRIVGYTPPIQAGDVYVLNARANRSTHQSYSGWFLVGTGLYIHMLTGSGFGSGNSTAFAGTPGHSYIITEDITPGTSTGTKTTLSIADATAPNTILATVTLDNDTTAGVQAAGSLGVADYTGTSKWTRLQTYTYAATPAMTASPATATTNTSESVTVTGTNTAWTSGTTFSVAGGTGASISGLSVNVGAQTATFTLNPGSAAATLTISDNTDSATTTIAVSTPSGLASGTLGVPASTASSISFSVGAGSGGTGAKTAQIYKTSPIIPGFVPPGQGVAVGSVISTFPTTFTDNAPGSALVEYKAVYTDSANNTVVSLPVFGKVKSGSDLVVGFIGDSFGVQTPGFETHPVTTCNRIAQLTQRNVTCANQCSSGTTSGNWQPGGALYNGAKAAFASSGVTHILIMLGINDTYTGIETPPATYLANMLAIVNQLKADFPKVPIQIDYHSTPVPDAYRGAGGVYWPENVSLGLLLSYQGEINAIVASTPGVDLGDTEFWEWAAQYTNFLPDGLHPGADGMLQLAEYRALAFVSNYFPASSPGGGSGGSGGGTSGLLTITDGQIPATIIDGQACRLIWNIASVDGSNLTLSSVPVWLAKGDGTSDKTQTATIDVNNAATCQVHYDFIATPAGDWEIDLAPASPQTRSVIQFRVQRTAFS